ncbi:MULTISPECIES: hypothetical protein [Sphingomonas]|uniref:Uncharacterized protein n=1 Tax=Sphingomonas molluscorum TaxID=418184 RepID=A0ABU8Q527_9SPHN|nr:hypothetical protein [Sphingomonas sp. JUb134]MBM7406231.1 hypothetical protein [Sphingomonas sp. JUb134]
MLKDPRSARERAINALASFIRNDGVERYFGIVSRALVLPGNLVIVAGDETRAIDPFALRAFALKEGVSVLATWTDKMLSGHTFEIDAVLPGEGDAVHYPALRLWTVPKRGAFLVSADDAGVAIAIDAAGISPAPRLPYRNKADRMLGIASGQALLQQLVFGGTPYATPLPRNLGR